MTTSYLYVCVSVICCLQLLGAAEEGNATVQEQLDSLKTELVNLRKEHQGQILQQSFDNDDDQLKISKINQEVSQLKYQVDTFRSLLMQATLSMDDNQAKIERHISALNQTLQSFNDNQVKIERHISALNQTLQSMNIHDCAEIYKSGSRASGVYTIMLGGYPAQVYCYMGLGGGWTVVQNRFDGSQDFYLDWESYRTGFGSLSQEFWWGNDNLAAITKTKSYALRVNLEDFDGNTAYAEYSTFSVGPASDNYRLRVSGYSGTAGPSLATHNNQQFSTYDRDNDALSSNCAVNRHGAFWYSNCATVNLNGRYYTTPTENDDGLYWFSWKRFYSVKASTMMIRPADYEP